MWGRSLSRWRLTIARLGLVRWGVGLVWGDDGLMEKVRDALERRDEHNGRRSVDCRKVGLSCLYWCRLHALIFS